MASHQTSHQAIAWTNHDKVVICINKPQRVNTLRPRQDGGLFPDDIFKSIFFNENVQIEIKISLTFVPKAPINNIPALVQIMAWRRLGDKPLSEPMMVSLLTHICVTRPQWVNVSLNFHITHWGSGLVLFGTKPLPQKMFTYHQLISNICHKIYSFNKIHSLTSPWYYHPYLFSPKGAQSPRCSWQLSWWGATIFILLAPG